MTISKKQRMDRRRNRIPGYKPRRFQIESLENRFAMAGNLFFTPPTDGHFVLDAPPAGVPPIVFETIGERFDEQEGSDTPRTVWELDLEIDDLWEPHVREMHQHAWVDHPMDERQGFFIQPNWENGLALHVRPEQDGMGQLSTGWYVEVPTEVLWQQWTQMNAQEVDQVMTKDRFDTGLSHLLLDTPIWKLRVEYASSSDPVWAKLWLEPELSVDSNRLQMENPSAIYFGEIYSAPATETQLNPEGQPNTAEDTTTANLNDWTALRPRGLAIAHHAHVPFEPILDNASEGEIHINDG